MKKIVAVAILCSGVLFAQSAETLIEQNGCLSCHAIASKKAAPAFAGIAKRNMRFEGSGAKEVIMNSIANGSKGKYPMFADMEMPSFKNFSKEELSSIADYILSQSSKARCNAKGHGMGQGMQMGRGMR